jgi:hypothetical protein
MADRTKRQKLHEAFHNGSFQSPEKLADLIAELLDCPVTIEDANHHLISYSKHNEEIDRARLFTIIQRKVPEPVINGLWKSGVMKKLMETDEPVIISPLPDIGLGNRVAISIRSDNEILGFIWAHTKSKTFQKEELILFKMAAQLVKKHFLQKSGTLNNQAKEYRDFFWQLLMGDVQEEQTILQKARELSMDLQGRLAIIIFDLGTAVTETLEKHADDLAESTEQMELIGRLADGQQLIFLVRVKDPSDEYGILHKNIEHILFRLGKFLQTDRLVGGSGLLYSSPLFLSSSYRQAQRVLRLKKQWKNELENVYTFQELGIYQFIEELYQIKARENYRNIVLDKLREYDQKNHTELLQSLKVFLENDGNTFVAAKKIHVHPNTLSYRLKRIQEISGMDLKDPKQKTNIYIDLLLEDLFP